EAAGRGLMVEAIDDAVRLRERIGALLKPPVLVAPTRPPAKPKAAPEDLERLAGRKVLVVDDDVRNIFALTSLLERYGIEVAHTDNGRSAIAMLREADVVDIV